MAHFWEGLKLKQSVGIITNDLDPRKPILVNKLVLRFSLGPKNELKTVLNMYCTSKRPTSINNVFGNITKLRVRKIRDLKFGFFKGPISALSKGWRGPNKHLLLVDKLEMLIQCVLSCGEDGSDNWLKVQHVSSFHSVKFPITLLLKLIQTILVKLLVLLKINVVNKTFCCNHCYRKVRDQIKYRSQRWSSNYNLISSPSWFIVRSLFMNIPAELMISTLNQRWNFVN